MIPTLETKRLLLRAPKPTDYDIYCAFFADADASAFYGGAGRWPSLAGIGHGFWPLGPARLWPLGD